MPSPYDPYDQSRRARPRRGMLTHWVPLVVTVTIATIGIAAWIWSERNDGEDDENYPPPPPPPEDAGAAPANADYYGGSYRDLRDDGARTAPPSYAGDLRTGEAGYGTTRAGAGPSKPPPGGARAPDEPQSYMTRMSGALRRTPSPQQFFDGASKTVQAGVAAAGAMVSGALASIREEDKDAFRDHETWSQEGEKSTSREPAPAPAASGKRKTVAVVVSADAHLDMSGDDGFHQEHASLLSHLPRNIDLAHTRLFVLIYAPNLTEHPLDSSATRPPPSLSSSFSNIGHEQAQTPTGEGADKPMLASSTPAFNAAFSEAQMLAESEKMILPFTTPTGHLHLMRHLSPDIVYLQESLTGKDGEHITTLQTWLKHDIVVVVGSEDGHGGLADSESELDHAPAEHQHWWEREDRVGLGRGVVVVEGLRLGDDWMRRVEGRD